MYLTQLFESDANPMVAIYPGRFQPFHKGHYAVYNFLVKKYGRDNVYITTSNKVAPPKSPFSFSDKLAFMRLTGVPLDRVIETREPYKPSELLNNYPNNARVIFCVSAKDMAEDPRFARWSKKDGNPTYFQPMPSNAAEMQGKDRHGYILVAPTFQFTVLNQPMNSATQIRELFAKSDQATQQLIIKDLFGSYDAEVHKIMQSALHEDAAGVGVIASKKQKRDPRYSNSMTVDIQPGAQRKMMRALSLI